MIRVVGAALHVRLPDLVTVEQDLVAVGNSVAGAFACALITLVAEVLQTEVDVAICCQRQIGGDDGILESRTEERVEHGLTDAAQLANAGMDTQRYVLNVFVPCTV